MAAVSDVLPPSLSPFQQKVIGLIKAEVADDNAEEVLKIWPLAPGSGTFTAVIAALLPFPHHIVYISLQPTHASIFHENINRARVETGTPSSGPVTTFQAIPQMGRSERFSFKYIKGPRSIDDIHVIVWDMAGLTSWKGYRLPIDTAEWPCLAYHYIAILPPLCPDPLLFEAALSSGVISVPDAEPDADGAGRCPDPSEENIGAEP